MNKQLEEIIFKVLEPDVLRKQIIPEAKFTDDLGVDSLDKIQILMSIGENFCIDIPDEDAEALQTVGRLDDYISQRLAEKEKMAQSSDAICFQI